MRDLYSSFKDLLEKLEAGDGNVITYKRNDSRLALGILLYRVILVDGRVRPEETELFRNIAENHLEVTEDELSGFERSAKELATSPEAFEKLIAELKDLPDEKKDEIIAFMQDISISDREFHELEANLVAKIDAFLRN
ncbi:MAG: TerB family tellurite resistance protein [Pseudomonadota bacterium]